MQQGKSGQQHRSGSGELPRRTAATPRRVRAIRAAPKPTVSAYVSPNPVNVGQTYYLVTGTNNATSLYFSCGYPISSAGYLSVGPLSTPLTAITQHRGTSTCTFTASGPGGSRSTTASVTIR